MSNSSLEASEGETVQEKSTRKRPATDFFDPAKKKRRADGPSDPSNLAVSSNIV